MIYAIITIALIHLNWTLRNEIERDKYYLQQLNKKLWELERKCPWLKIN
jgi:hypothetical protein